MAKLYSEELEQRLLVCCLETKSPVIRSAILETDIDDFGSEFGIMVRRRIAVLRDNGKSFGSALDMAEDPAISSSKGAVAFIKATTQKRRAAAGFSKDSVQGMLNSLKNFRKIRLLFGMGHQLSGILDGELDEDKLEEAIRLAEDALAALNRGDGKTTITHYGKRQDKDAAAKDVAHLLDFEENQFISTGLESLDAHLHGFERGNLVTISAPRGGGKTTSAMVASLNQFMKDNRNICFVSMEMEEIELKRRIVASLSGVDHDIVRYPKNITEEQASATKRAYKNWVSHGWKNDCCYTIMRPKDTRFTPQKMEDYVRPFGCDVLYVDYITLFDSLGRDQWVAQMEYSRYLKNMASRLNCVVVALSQLSEEERVKYGKALEENTDYWLWWRWREDEEQVHGNVEMRLAKARHAASRKFMAKFKLDKMTIETGYAVEQAAAKAQGKKKGVDAGSNIWNKRK